MMKHQATPLEDDTDWADRSEYWRTFEPVKRGRRKKYRFREPLIICGHGANIRVDHNTLLVRNGFTHSPQMAETLRFFPGDPNLPGRIIVLDAGGAITFDAVNWISDQNIPFVQLDWRGRVSFSGNSGFSANPKLVRWQIGIQGTEKARKLNCRLISEKFDACISTIKCLFGNSKPAELAIKRIGELKSKISAPTTSFQTILGIEGAASAIYYRLWHELPLKWSGLSKKPIPHDWAKVGARQMIWQRTASNARHPLNAMLNYGYSILISEIQTAVIAAGYDPAIGIAHQRNKNSIPLVYDLMEPMRPLIDREILAFVLEHTFTPGDFNVNRNGGCRLNPQLAKTIVRNIGTRKRGQIVSILNYLGP